MLDVAKKLKSLESGNLPLDVFTEIARLTVTPVVEIVPFFRDKNSKLKVLLLQQDNDHSLWPGMYHVPGSIVLATDKPGSLHDVLQRILENKLKTYEVSNLNLVDTQLCSVSRGTELAIIYSANIADVFEHSILFDPSALPKNMIQGHAGFIEAAVEKLELS